MGISAPGTASRRFRIVVVIELVFLAVQGWAGDSVNLFAGYPSSYGASYLSTIESVTNVEPILLYHEFGALIILALGVVLAGASIKMRNKTLVVSSLLALSAVISALVGGLLFVLSGFSQDGFSAQMGGSYIAAYGLYLVLLYYSK